MKHDHVASPQRSRRLIVAAAGLCLLSPSWRAARAEPPAPFVLGMDTTETTFYGRWLQRVYGEALQRLNLRLELAIFPTKRLSIMADQGSIDGEMLRAPGYGAEHPELIRVDESLMQTAFSVYGARSMPGIKRLEDLPTAGLPVLYRRGVAGCENALRALLPAHRLSEVTTTLQGLEMLSAGRAAFFCEVDSSVWNVLYSPPARHPAEVEKLFDIGAPVPLHPYLHRKHADLVPRLASTLKQMKAEGLLEHYRLEVIGGVQRSEGSPPPRR